MRLSRKTVEGVALGARVWAGSVFAADTDAEADTADCGPGCAHDHGKDHDHFVGGQAILEGVMMRGRRSWGLAVRRPSGDIARHSFDLPLLGERHPVFKLPVVRGIGALWESLSLGIKALSLSANLSLGDTGVEGSAEPSGPSAASDDATAPDGPAAQPDDPVASDGPATAAVEAATEVVPAAPAKAQADPMQLGFRELAVSMVLAMVVAVGLFIALPLFVAKLFGETLANPFLFNLTEGIVRLAIFVGYILVISRLPDLRRVFEYHGAEHKTIHAYEAGDPLDPEHVEPYPTLHPRCGTAFLLVVMVMAVLVFAVVGKPALPYLILSRLIGIPFVAGLSYEVIRYGGRHKDGLVSRGLLWPGLMMQKLTTRQPTTAQVEVAIEALQEVLRVEAGGASAPYRLPRSGGAPA
jgi:uncharacterized protein YqhQ